MILVALHLRHGRVKLVKAGGNDIRHDDRNACAWVHFRQRLQPRRIADGRRIVYSRAPLTVPLLFQDDTEDVRVVKRADNMCARASICQREVVKMVDR